MADQPNVAAGDENLKPEGGIKTDLLKDISPHDGGGDKREASPDKSTDGTKKFHPNLDEGKKPEQQSPVKEKTPEQPVVEKITTPDRPAVDEKKKTPPVTPAEEKKTPASPADDKKKPVSPVVDKKTPAGPADNKKTPAVPAEDKTPKQAVDENKPEEKQVFGLRPNQDNTFDDEHFEVKMYAHETDKDKKEPEGIVVEPKTEHTGGVSGTVVNKSEPASTLRQIKVVEDEEEEEEEEDHDANKAKITPKIAPIFETSKPKLDRESSSFDESEDPLAEEAEQALTPEEKKVLIETKPVVEGFLASYHQIIEREVTDDAPSRATMSTQTDRTPSPCIPMFHQQPLSPAAQTGQKLSQVAVQFDAEYRPIVNNLVQQWLQELKRLNDGQQPTIKAVWESFRKIVQEVFRDGYSWSKIIILLMFVFEVVVHLYNSYVPKTVQQFIRWFLKFLVSAGVTSWVARQGGWAVGSIGVVEEHSRTAVAAATGAACSFCPPEVVRSPLVLAAAAGVLLAGAAYMFFKKN